MRPSLSPLLVLACAAHTAGALTRLCDVLRVLREERDQCLQELSRDGKGDLVLESLEPGCAGLWDNMSCWPSSAPGRTVEVECPRFLRMLTSRNGSLFRNCTQDGWSETFPRPDLACGVNVNDSSIEKRHVFLLKLKVMYTVGYSASLVMLLVALSILCAFRRLHCTRNYIHMHLFVSFILRALSNFIKDAVLFSSDDVTYCDAHRVGCKLVMVFFQYCIMANYAWLLVEGLYLHTLLVTSFFSERKCLQEFVALGWGSPAIFVTSWAITRHFLEDVGCWDINTNASIWWVIRGPVILSILINFIFFINILRILLGKLKTQETGNEVSHYKRLAKSTLLLIPLFGVHYTVFAFSPEDAMEIQLFFELALGSFQGLVVAVLYCFLNGEVQLEIQKKWRQWHLQFPLCPMARNSSFSNGTSDPTHGTKAMSKANPSEQSRGTCRASII
ncbi:secretin receptor isoform X7 [Fukomys damarensis]|uniref:Secretin receptor n=1 Tax=Fukomys damarensis TaxID=885580 RepID=A0A091DCI7_FUKDA|nr:secretin receptor isoform X7 [Fukomys damarensis]KFO29849.1 Secretin receptor [Fukomys damarensis]